MGSIFKSEFRNPSRTTGRVGTKERTLKSQEGISKSGVPGSEAIEKLPSLDDAQIEGRTMSISSSGGIRRQAHWKKGQGMLINSLITGLPVYPHLDSSNYSTQFIAY